MSTFSKILKRLLDILGSALALALLSPLLLLIALLVKLDSPGPAFFRQRRLGKAGRVFDMYKFRTMVHNAPAIRNPDGSYFVGPQDSRLTRVGRILRRYSLDEFPQFLNVLKGEMSLVGPRPDQEADLALYDDLLRIKLAVPPGMASLASVEGRNTLTWRERAEREKYYVEHAGLALDLRILLKTVPVVLLGRGVFYSDEYKARLRARDDSRPGRGAKPEAKAEF